MSYGRVVRSFNYKSLFLKDNCCGPTYQFGMNKCTKLELNIPDADVLCFNAVYI